MPRTLLLADDSVTIRRVIELTFTDENVRVVSVSSGREAIERIESASAEKPDIVLADVGMADVSGYDIAAYIKGRADLRHIPVVLLAGAFEPLDEARARQAGSDGVLVKPFEPQMVVARVRELLGTRASAAAQPPAGAYGIAPPPARPAAPRDLDSLDPEPPRAASSGSAATDPLFDQSLDQLDAAFGDTRPAKIDEAVVSEFAQDLKDLRSARPEPGFGHDDFGDWDLPSRGAAGEGSPTLESWEEPARAPVVEPAPVPPVILPPPVTLEARPVAAVTPAPPPAVAAPPVFARPAAPPPLADAFSSLLAAEEGRPHHAPVFPAYAPVPSAMAAPAALSDDEIERIAERVIVKLGANVRGTVIDLAASLVRAEIDRLKALR